MTIPNFRRIVLCFLVVISACACSTIHSSNEGRLQTGPERTTGFQDIGYASWTDAEPPYRIYPGDELEVTIPSAPELNKTIVVAPDGRVSLPLIRGVMVADQTTGEVESALTDAYSSQLLKPDVYVSVKTASPLKVFVGGEVDKSGVYDMPGDINALQAVIQAGGFKISANRGQVVLIRRGPGGQAMMRTVDLQRGLKDPSHTDLAPLRRFDIIYVPRSGLGELSALMSQLRDLVPGTLGFNYALNSQTVTKF